MGKYFGTDGFRGEANVKLTVDHAFKVGRYVGWYYGRDHKAKIVIGKDTRRSSYMFEYALVAGLTASGADAVSYTHLHAIAKNYGLKDEQVFVGVGSDDVLAMSFLTFFNSQKPVLFPDITYSFYDVWADLFRIPYERPALDENFHIRTEDYFRENGGIVFPNPNAPTGVEIPLEEVEDIIRHNPDVIVIVDEAYVDFGGQSALDVYKRQI